MPAQRGDSIPSSKISLSSLLSEISHIRVIRIMIHLNCTISPSFFHRLHLIYHLNHVSVGKKKRLIVVLIFEISLKRKNKVMYVISVLISSNILKLLFLWLTTRAIAYSAIYGKRLQFCKR